jgi:hypothetical protein
VTAVVLAVAEEELKTGPIGLLIVLLMLIATAFLIRNMNSRIKRLPREFPGQDEDPTPPKEQAP